MKLVINAAYGGFGLTHEAERDLFAVGCGHQRVMTVEKYTGGRGLSKYSLANMLDSGDVLVDDHDRPENRACGALVALIEQFGDHKGGKFAQLKVVEIPDDVEWTIDEYDGWESIHEAHRSWGG